MNENTEEADERFQVPIYNTTFSRVYSPNPKISRDQNVLSFLKTSEKVHVSSSDTFEYFTFFPMAKVPNQHRPSRMFKLTYFYP